MRHAPNMLMFDATKIPLKTVQAFGKKLLVVCQMTLAGLEPAIFGSEDQRLIH